MIERVGLNELADGTVVSTVKLPTYPGGTLEEWETMVFPPPSEEDETAYTDNRCERWTTREEAVAGHAQILKEEMERCG